MFHYKEEVTAYAKSSGLQRDRPSFADAWVVQFQFVVTRSRAKWTSENPSDEALSNLSLSEGFMVRWIERAVGARWGRERPEMVRNDASR